MQLQSNFRNRYLVPRDAVKNPTLSQVLGKWGTPLAAAGGVAYNPAVGVPALAASRAMYTEPGRRALLGQTAAQEYGRAMADALRAYMPARRVGAAVAATQQPEQQEVFIPPWN